MDNHFMSSGSRIFVAGHLGLVGSAICRALKERGYHNLLVKSRQQLNLLDDTAVKTFFAEERPDFVFLAAAKVGGILANNNFPADFIRENLRIQSNVIDSSHISGVKRLLFLGSSCIYPKAAPQPLKESFLLSGPLEITNRPYAIAKIAGIEQCWSYNRQFGTRYLAAMPTNLYGPNDNFDLNASHVLPALVRKAVEGQVRNETHITVWGTGSPRREFLYSDDLADACLFLMNLDEASYDRILNSDNPPLVNIGTGTDVSIIELASLVTRLVGFQGQLVFDHSKPNGTHQKLLDVSRLRDLGWAHTTNLETGLRKTIAAYRSLLTSESQRV